MMKEEEKLYTKELYDLSHTAAAPCWRAPPTPGRLCPR